VVIQRNKRKQKLLNHDNSFKTRRDMCKILIIQHNTTVNPRRYNYLHYAEITFYICNDQIIGKGVFIYKISYLQNIWRNVNDCRFNINVDLYFGACGSVVGWGTMLQTGRSRIRFPISSMNLLNLPNPSRRTIDLWSKARPARKADILTAVCEPIY
jgi:hypothetical protein